MNLREEIKKLAIDLKRTGFYNAARAKVLMVEAKRAVQADALESLRDASLLAARHRGTDEGDSIALGSSDVATRVFNLLARAMASVDTSSRAERRAGAGLVRTFFMKDANGRRVHRTSVYDGKVADFDTSAGRWQCFCEVHETVVSFETKAQALDFAADPAEWCDECAAAE